MELAGSVVPPKLLVVDDEWAVAELICRAAEAAGFEATSRCDGVDLSILKAETPAVIVMDLQMAGCDGVEILRELAASTREPAIFLVSGLGERMLETASEWATALGFRVLGHMSKPFTVGALCERLVQARRDIACEIERPVALSEQVTPEQMIRALLEGEIVPWYQPIVSVATGELVGAEALARWESPTMGSIIPCEFVPVLESHGFSRELNWRILQAVLVDLKLYFPAGTAPISVNFSAQDLADLTLPDRLSRAVSGAGLLPSAIQIELTESSMISNLPCTLETLIRLRMRGFGLLLDDFGTGYSSMEQLRRLPLTALKIDRSFLSPHPSADDQVLLQSLIQLAHQLGLQAIAEGVEKEGQFELLRQFQCDKAQGYLLAKPMRAEVFYAWVQERNSHSNEAKTVTLSAA